MFFCFSAMSCILLFQTNRNFDTNLRWIKYAPNITICLLFFFNFPYWNWSICFKATFIFYSVFFVVYLSTTTIHAFNVSYIFILTVNIYNRMQTSSQQIKYKQIYHCIFQFGKLLQGPFKLRQVEPLDSFYYQYWSIWTLLEILGAVMVVIVW
jgi:hypothetical protein